MVSGPARTVEQRASLVTTSDLAAKLDSSFRRGVGSRLIADSVIRVERGSFEWEASHGALDASAPYFIASATKLYVTAVVLSLRAEGKLDLGDRMIDLLPAGSVEALHVIKGVDRTADVTVGHLLAHTSGLADYFQHRRPNGTVLMDSLLAGDDRGWNLTDVIEAAREIGALFPPGRPGRAHYSDTNFQLLGAIIEQVTGQDLDSAYTDRVYRPLGLTATYRYSDPADRTPLPLRHKNGPLVIPKAMASFGPDGGIVSTARESMRFVRGFFGGELFPADYLPELYRWNRIFFPLQSGVGLHRFALPRLMAGRAGPVALFGHSGLSGAFTFWDPRRDVYFAGTVNQVAKPGLSYRLMVRLAAQM